MNLEEIKKLYEECEQNVDALAFEMAIPVAELLARGENEAADKLDKENRANLEDFMRNHVGSLCDADVEEVLEEYAYNTLNKIDYGRSRKIFVGRDSTTPRT